MYEQQDESYLKSLQRIDRIMTAQYCGEVISLRVHSHYAKTVDKLRYCVTPHIVELDSRRKLVQRDYETTNGRKEKHCPVKPQNMGVIQ